MKKSDYIGHEEYLDSPMVYGQHKSFWNSLSFLKKVDTIRRVGLLSFLREVLGLADSERTHKRLEQKYSALCYDCETMQEQIATLSQEKQELEQKLEKAEKAREASRNMGYMLFAPPSAQDIMNAFNRSSVDEMKPWFFNPYEDPNTGTVTLHHNFAFYPFASILVPRGKLCLRNQYGKVVNLAQCADYSALPAKYAQHLIPQEFHAYRMRVLFVTRDRDFWLAEPRSAQDVVLEIHAKFTEERDYTARHATIKSWTEQYHRNHAVASGYQFATLFNLIVSIEELLGGGQNNFSMEQIKRIRDKCYAEYLDIYFNPCDGEN